MLKTSIVSGKGKDKAVNVDNDGHLYVIQAPFPPAERQKTRPFTQLFTTDGTASGTSDMGVDGSSTSVEYYIPADAQTDLYITEVSIVVGYASSAQPYEFADGTALTNGVRFYYSSVFGEQEIDSELRNNSDFLRIANSSIVPTAWEVRGVGGLNDYGFFCTIDLSKYAYLSGIKLDKATNQKIAFVVRDNATAATTFNIKASGFKRFE